MNWQRLCLIVRQCDHRPAAELRRGCGFSNFLSTHGTLTLGFGGCLTPASPRVASESTGAPGFVPGTAPGPISLCAQVNSTRFGIRITAAISTPRPRTGHDRPRKADGQQS